MPAELAERLNVAQERGLSVSEVIRRATVNPTKTTS